MPTATVRREKATKVVVARTKPLDLRKLEATRAISQRRRSIARVRLTLLTVTLLVFENRFVSGFRPIWRHQHWARIKLRPARWLTPHDGFRVLAALS